MPRPSSRTAVIVSTFERPRALEIVLEALDAQSDRGFEIVVAADGSGRETVETVERFRARTDLRIDHVRHEHRGFRKTKIVNAAVRAAGSAEMLAFLDQDAVPGRDWMALHKATYAPNRFVTGGYVRLSAEETESLDAGKVRDGAHERLLTPRRVAALWRRHVSNLAYLAMRLRCRPRMMGLNFSVARDLFERVNGYDEAYVGWGKEDSDLRTRMRRAGGGARCLWHRAVVFHLWHARASTDWDSWIVNKARHALVKRGELPWRCERGLATPERAAS